MDVCITLDNDIVSLPHSRVRAPGFLMKDKKDPQEVKTGQKHIQNLLECFRLKAESPESPLNFQSNCFDFNTEKSSFCTDSMSSPADLSNLYVSEFRFGPGKRKNLNDEMLRIIQKAKEILSIYGIDLIINSGDMYLQEVCNMLKYLIPEVCSFTSSFFKNLKISKLVICEEEDLENYSFNLNTSLVIELLETEEKVLERLHKIILDHLVLIKPEIAKEWKDIEVGGRIVASDSFIVIPTRLEEAFLALMKRGNHAFIQPKVTQLRALLAKHYPAEMSDVFFRNRNKEKKRLLKVSFSETHISWKKSS